MRNAGIDAFLVPRSDAFQGEQVPPSEARLAWLTGFTGSAGLGIVLQDGAAMLVDGRYTLQVAQETDGTIFDYPDYETVRPADYLKASLTKGAKIGFDPWLHTVSAVEQLRQTLTNTDLELVALATNPIDTIWRDRPAPPASPIRAYPSKMAGQSSRAKREQLAAELSENQAGAFLLCQPEGVAWLMNWRADDVPFTPVALCFALLRADGSIDLLCDTARLTADLAATFDATVRFHRPQAWRDVLTDTEEAGGGNPVWIDPAKTPEAMAQCLTEAGIPVMKKADPVEKAKAVKNDAEIAGMRSCHRRDGLALITFLSALDTMVTSGTLTERDAAQHLSTCRAQQTGHLGPSFETIAGSGPNGAIVHYRVTPETDRVLEPGTLFLLDSGAHYQDGTTDVTRTVAIGTPSADQRRHYTLVLKGHLALSHARFPKGTTGAALDAIARAPLWAVGLDFDHGTGHGVGHCLSVHEGPARIAKRDGGIALEPGMILSNEPGYYRTGDFGIRIENLVLVREDTAEGDERAMLGFETLTCVPYDRRLIDGAMLTETERAQIDAYHQWVWAALTRDADLPVDICDWLKRATAPLEI